jgi:dolichol-phosphate mannosyltransferase
LDPGRAGSGPDLNDPPPALSVVIPAYNEGENIVPVLRELHEHVHVAPKEVLIVYDFAEDTTVPVVERLLETYPDVRLVLNRFGRGALNALRTGLLDARAPYVLVTMADLSDDLRDVDAMYRLALEGADVVAGSRYMHGGGQQGGPLVKRSLSRAAGLSLHFVGGVGTHDPTNNFKLYSRRLLQSVQIESSGGFELALELTVKAHLAGFGVAEVPTQWNDRTAGQSRFQLRRWLPHYLRWYRQAMLARIPFA